MVEFNIVTKQKYTVNSDTIIYLENGIPLPPLV